MTKKPEQELAKSDDLIDLAEQYAGKGVSDREEDRIQSWVKVLHQLSPELNSREPSYVDKAKPGDIWVAAQNLLIPGDEGFDFQQCGYQYAWVEWPGAPGSGGRPIARHSERPAHLGGESTAIGRIDLPSGHQIIETRYHMGLVYVDGQAPFPAIISYSSTGSPVSINWTQRQRAHRLKSGAMAPSFMYLWRMITIERSNERGRWFLLTPKRDEIVASKDQFASGIEVAQKIAEQQLKLGEDEGISAQIDQIPF